MQIPFVQLKELDATLAQEIETAVQDVLKSGWYILGKEVQQFEASFARYLGVKHVIAVANGTDAIELALRAYDIGAGDEVITVSHTAMPTVTAIERAGASPVLVDIDPETFLMDCEHAKQAITDRTKAIIPVHLYGQPVEIKALKQLVDEHDLLLMEDCAQAHGALYEGQMAGTFGQLSSFSFYPTKNLGAYGDAGAIATDDDDLAERIKRIRNYGQSSKYYNVERGVNSRMDDIQAAILNVKLKYLDEHNDKRRELAAYYHEHLNGVVCPVEREYVHHVYHLFVIRHPQRDALQAYLKERGVQTLIHYPVPIHMQESHRDLGYGESSLPETEHAAKEILSLPLHPQLTREEQDRVIELVNAFCEQEMS